MKIKVTYIISNINKALAFEWIAYGLDKDKFELSFILLNPGESALQNYLQTIKVNVISICYKGKKDLPKVILSIYRILKREKIQVVHCHLFDACIAGLIAATLAGVKNRIFTRHHATFHHTYFPRAVWYDRFINAMATDIVAISENVRQTLIGEGVKPRKIHLIHHGFDLDAFEKPDKVKVEKLGIKYNTDKAFPIIGVVSRYFELKGIQYVVPAFKQLLAHYPKALLILANASGNYKKEISLLLSTIPIESHREIPFEEDISSLYQLFNVFIHVPIDSQLEAFGQTYVEALAAGIPSIFTLSGVAQEFIVHHKNAYVVPFKDSTAIYNAMLELLNNVCLKERIIIEGKIDVKKHFHLQQMITKLEEIYD